MYNDILKRYRMFLSVWCQLPVPLALLFTGSGSDPATKCQSQPEGEGQVFVRLCLVTSHQGKHKAMTQTTISWPLLVIELIDNWGCVWSLGVANAYMWQRAYSWLAVAMWEKEHFCVVEWESISMCVSGSVCGIILENLSLWRGTDVDLHMWRVPSLWWD